MLFFLVPFVISDIKYLASHKKIDNVHDRYSAWAHLAFQGMNPVVFIVAVVYQLLMAIDPRLLFGDADWTIYPWSMMQYLHGGNYLMMQLEYFSYVHPHILKRKKAVWSLCYVIIYFGIYGSHSFFNNN
jgi:hypothetical protein